MHEPARITRRRFATCSVAGAAVAAGAPFIRSAHAVSQPVIQTIEADAQGWGVNNADQVVVTMKGRSYLYTGPSGKEIARPKGIDDLTACGVSDQGVVVGSFHTVWSMDAQGNVKASPAQGFVHDGVNFKVLNFSGMSETFLRGISPDGRVVSGYGVATGSGDQVGALMTFSGSQVNHPRPGGRVLLQGMNGWLAVGGSVTPALNSTQRRVGLQGLAGQQLADVLPPAGFDTLALRAVNNDLAYAGWGVRSRDKRIVGLVLKQQSVVAVVEVPKADATYLQGINNNGWLVSGSYDANGTSYAFTARLL